MFSVFTNDWWARLTRLSRFDSIYKSRDTITVHNNSPIQWVHCPWFSSAEKSNEEATVSMSPVSLHQGNCFASRASSSHGKFIAFPSVLSVHQRDCITATCKFIARATRTYVARALAFKLLRTWHVHLHQRICFVALVSVCFVGNHSRFTLTISHSTSKSNTCHVSNSFTWQFQHSMNGINSMILIDER